MDQYTHRYVFDHAVNFFIITFSLQMYKITIDFFMLILYPKTLLNSLIVLMNLLGFSVCNIRLFTYWRKKTVYDAHE